METKNFWPIKDTVKRMKGQTTDWGKIFAKHISYKGLYPEDIKNSQVINK